MGEEAAPAVRIEVLWRPGCPFCSRLRRGLARAGIATVEHDIWADPEAAARVREVTGGDETVPTVLVGSRALVNPSVAGVVAAVRAEFPDEAEALVGSPATAGTRRLPVGAVGAVWAVWAVGLAVIWVLLSVLQATTTWHLAPVLIAGVWPWMTARDLRAAGGSGAVGLILAGVGAFAVSAAATAALSRADLLRGPTIPGFPNATVESVVLAGATVVLVVAVTLLNKPRPGTSQS